MVQTQSLLLFVQVEIQPEKTIASMRPNEDNFKARFIVLSRTLTTKKSNAPGRLVLIDKDGRYCGLVLWLRGITDIEDLMDTKLAYEEKKEKINSLVLAFRLGSTYMISGLKCNRMQDPET